MKKLGALFSPIDVRDYQLDMPACSANVEIPEEFELQMCGIKNQGSVGSCVAHSIAEVIEYFNSIQINDSTPMSTGYIYGNRRRTTWLGEGLYVRDALDTTCKYGDVTHKDFPYNIEVPEAIDKFEEVAEDLFEKGSGARFTSYCKLKTDDEIKIALLKNGPVIFAIKWFNDIRIVKGEFKSDCDADKYSGGHCMVIYGWNERGWKVQNSWGEDWGDKGCAIMPFDFPIREAWCIVDNHTTNLPTVKPFGSKIGQFFAKIINFGRRIWYKLTKH